MKNIIIQLQKHYFIYTNFETRCARLPRLHTWVVKLSYMGHVASDVPKFYQFWPNEPVIRSYFIVCMGQRSSWIHDADELMNVL